MENLKIIGANIQMHRKLKSFTQEELANKASISKETLKKLESGNLNFTAKTFKKVLDALSLKLTWKMEDK